MTDKQPMQADGGGTHAAPEDGELHGKTDGESQGGAYPNPHAGRKPQFEGGQTNLEYSGPDNPNATTDDDDGGKGKGSED